MRTAFVLSFLANVMLAGVSWVVLPDRVAIHFGHGGVPDGWASSLTSSLMMVGMHVLMFSLLYFSPTLVGKLPKRWISLPNRDYWLHAGRRSEAVERLRRLIWQFGLALFSFMLFAGLLALQANLSDPIRLDERLFLIGLVVFLAYTVFWTVALLRAFRIPRNSQQ